MPRICIVLAALPITLMASAAWAQSTSTLSDPPKWMQMLGEQAPGLKGTNAPAGSSPTSPSNTAGTLPPTTATDGERDLGAQTRPKRPLWEAGIGAFGTYSPAYPASGDYSLNGLPVPYVIYRGNLFRAGDGAAAKVIPLKTQRFEFSVSADGSFPADSDESDVRDGMPDLDTLLEIGPELIIKGPSLGLIPGGRGRLDAALQSRAVFSVDFGDVDVAYQGLVFEPQIRYRQAGIFGQKAFFSARISPVFATEELQQYFYEVEPVFARAGRPAYQADAGYLGTEIRFSLGYSITENLSGFVSTGLDIHTGAANEDSPLFEEDITGSFALGFAYSFYKSEELER